jgi:hypothetical protein
MVRTSPETTYEVIHANTGSSAKISAVRVGVVCCCAQLCTASATAVANTAVAIRPPITAGVHWILGVSIHQKVDHPINALTAICVKLRTL